MGNRRKGCVHDGFSMKQICATCAQFARSKLGSICLDESRAAPDVEQAGAFHQPTSQT